MVGLVVQGVKSQLPHSDRKSRYEVCLLLCKSSRGKTEAQLRDASKEVLTSKTKPFNCL